MARPVSLSTAVFNMDTRGFVNVGVDEIFDRGKYQSVLCVGYVGSGEFITRYLSGFPFAEVIIGIDDSSILSSITRVAQKNICADGLHLFESLTEEEKDAVAENAFCFRFADNGHVIHSKIYLLKGKRDGEECRLTVGGSANISLSAFGVSDRKKNGMQLEDIWISEDPSVFSLYEERYNFIRKSTVDYIPNRCKQVWLNERRLLNDDEFKIASAEYVQSNADAFAVSTSSVSELKKLAKSESESKEAEVTTKIIEMLTGKAKNGKRRVEKDKPVSVVKTVYHRKRGSINKAEELSKRKELLYSDELHCLIDVDKVNQNGCSPAFGKKLSKEGINQQLSLVEEFLGVYIRHSVNGDGRESARRAYDILLHGFFSPFAWRMRKDLLTYFNNGDGHNSVNNMVVAVPNILIINGQSSTGKSVVLAALNKLLQNGEHDIPRWVDYREEQERLAMDNAVRSNNVFPLIIDEVESDFINTPRCRYKGAAWIKNTANSLGEDAHPFMIVASNKAISPEGAVIRRTAYVMMNTILENSAETKAEFSSIISQMDDSLFRDFCFRLETAITKGKSIYKKRYDRGDECFDVAGFAREIFKNYYRCTGRKIPEYFPDEPTNDFFKAGKQQWRDLWLDSGTKKKMFRPRMEDGHLVLIADLECVRNKKEILNQLDDRVRKESVSTKNERFVHLDPERFFAWIEVENPYRLGESIRKTGGRMALQFKEKLDGKLSLPSKRKRNAMV